MLKLLLTLRITRRENEDVFILVLILAGQVGVEESTDDNDASCIVVH